MSGAALPKKTATLADLLTIPEEDRFHEIIDGELVEKEAASARHGAAQGTVFSLLSPYRRRGGPPERPGGWWFATEVEIAFALHQVCRPDVAGWRRERLPDLPAEVPIRVAPDWVCEVISPSMPSRDLVKKKRIYHQHQVPHYWIIDPRDETLTALRWSADGYVEVLLAERGERVHAEPFDAIELQVGVFFGDDEEERGA